MSTKYLSVGWQWHISLSFSYSFFCYFHIVKIMHGELDLNAKLKCNNIVLFYGCIYKTSIICAFACAPNPTQQLAN